MTWGVLGTGDWGGRVRMRCPISGYSVIQKGGWAHDKIIGYIWREREYVFSILSSMAP